MTLLARELSFDYRQRPVLQGVNLHLRPGEVVALLGANGAGKSTLLRLLLGLQMPSAGEILLDERPLHQRPRRDIAQRLAYVPQAHVAPFPYRVSEVVLLGRLAASGLFAAPSAVDRRIAEAALTRLGIAHLAERPYSEISGGERQLALIARALTQEARLLILDEPATGLDYGHQMRLLSILRSLATDGYGVLMSTHHPEHALIAADRVLLLHQGRIAASGPPAETITTAAIELLYGLPVTAVRDAEQQLLGFRPRLATEPTPAILRSTAPKPPFSRHHPEEENHVRTPQTDVSRCS